MKLRPYQSAGLDMVRRAYASGKRAPVLVSPTGSGKTVCASAVISGAVSKGRRVLFLAHRRELCEQASDKLAACGIEHDMIAQPAVVRQAKVAHFRKFGRSWVVHGAPVQIGMVQTVVKRLDSLKRFAPDLIVIDECHLSIASTYQQTVAAIPDARLLGLTATPVRLDGRGLSELYDDLVVLCQPQELIDSGALVRPRIFTTPVLPDLSRVATRMGDFAAGELAEATDKPKLIGDAVDHYRRAAHGRPAIVFCVSIQHAEHTAEQFRAAGYRATAVSGDTEDGARAEAVAGLGSGAWDVVCNCGLYIEGLDQTAIGCVIDLAPTQSLTRYLQKVGRGLRPHTGKADCIVLDHAGNTARHGMPQWDREWSLDGAAKRKKRTQDEPDVRIATCTQCFAVHEPAPACPVCGFVYPVRPREVQQAEGELVEISAEQQDAMRRAARVLQGRAQSVHELMAQGMSRPRAEKILQARAEKQAMVDTILAGFNRARDAGRNPWQEFGTSLAGLRKMKPKELKALIATIGAAA